MHSIIILSYSKKIMQLLIPKFLAVRKSKSQSCNQYYSYYIHINSQHLLMVCKIKIITINKTAWHYIASYIAVYPNMHSCNIYNILSFYILNHDKSFKILIVDRTKIIVANKIMLYSSSSSCNISSYKLLVTVLYFWKSNYIANIKYCSVKHMQYYNVHIV